MRNVYEQWAASGAGPCPHLPGRCEPPARSLLTCAGLSPFTEARSLGTPRAPGSLTKGSLGASTSASEMRSVDTATRERARPDTQT